MGKSCVMPFRYNTVLVYLLKFNASGTICKSRSPKLEKSPGWCGAGGGYLRAKHRGAATGRHRGARNRKPSALTGGEPGAGHWEANRSITAAALGRGIRKPSALTDGASGI